LTSSSDGNGNNHSENNNNNNNSNRSKHQDPFSEFENGDERVRARLLLEELFDLVEYNRTVRRRASSETANGDHPPSADVLENEAYLSENCLIVAVALTYCRDLFSPKVLHFFLEQWLLCALHAHLQSPDFI